MKAVLCNGGLGNQTFQYIFSRFVELAGGADCYLDDSAFFGDKVEHNGFEIRNVFPNCRPRLLSEYFTDDVWQYMMQKKAEGKSIIQLWKELGENFTLVAETLDYQYDGSVVKVPTNKYLPWLAQAEGDIYYHGYWINRGYLKGEYEKELVQELTFAPFTEERNIAYEKWIAETNSVALHVRRGDFVKMKYNKPAEAYKVGVNALREIVSVPHFFIFSDDIKWCRDNLREMGLEEKETTFVKGNSGADSYRDMQLMACCKNVILFSESSFSYLAALLNRNETFYLVNGTSREV